MRRGSICLTLWLLLSTAPLVTAAECPEALPCDVPGGSYVALAPDGPVQGLLLFLHGYGGSGAAELRNTNLFGEALERGYAVVAPSALPMRPGSPTKWNSELDPTRRDDLAYLAAVLRDAGARFGVEPSASVAAGFSEGGMMIWRLACDAPQMAAAFAPVSGVMWRPLPPDCAAPVRLMHSHGWSDAVVPLEGRAIRADLIQGDVFESLALVRRASGCGDPAPNAYARRGAFEIRRWSECSPGADLVFALHPGGHGIPEGWMALMLDWAERPGDALTEAPLANEDGGG